MRIKRSIFIDVALERMLEFATHLICFLVFFSIFAFIGFVFGVELGAASLPIAVLFYICAAILLIAKYRRNEWKKKILNLLVFIISLFLIYGISVIWFSHTHDTSYDGQAYHQTAIISLMNGWNPIYDSKLPVGTLQGTPYVVGYPKILWEQYAGLALVAGNLNAATAINIIPPLIALLIVFYVCYRVFKLNIIWSTLVSLLAIASIYSVQQIFTFMADGTSFEFGLAAIALIAGMMKLKASPYKFLIPFFGLIIILVGTKFNNATLVIALFSLFLIHVYRTRLFLSRIFWRFTGVVTLCAIMALWSPYMVNYINQGTFIYPQNLAEPQATLKTGNIPPNIINEGPFVQLFYGVFGEIQPARAGDPKSPENIAKLKIPYTYSNDEIEASANFLGRIGSAGVLFSGAVISSLALLIILLLATKSKYNKSVVKYTLIGVGILLLLALVNPVANKLRYAPYITLIPLIILVGSLIIKSKKKMFLMPIQILIALTVLANIVLSTIGIGEQRNKEFELKDQQYITLESAKQPINLISTSFNSIGYQLNAHNIQYNIVEKCVKGESKTLIELSFQTAYYCKVNTNE